MPSARHIDANGFLLVKGCPLSSFGIFVYSAGQLRLPGDPMRLVNVYRPESAVSDPRAIASFMNVPLIDDHEMLSGFDGDEVDTAPEDKGLDGVLTGNVYYEKPWMRGDLKVFSRKMQKILAKGKKDLSLGYDCDFEEKPGVWEGQPYEVIQTNLRGNHIALVREGRVPGARVLDGRCFDHLSFDFTPSDKENTMGVKVKTMDKATRDSAVESLQTLIPQLTQALEQFMSEEAKEPEHQADPSADPAPAAADPVATDPADDVASQIEGSEDPVSADPITDPAAVDPAQADPANADDPNASTGAPDLAALISQAQAVLEQLASAAGAQGQDNEEPMQAQDLTEGLQEQSNVSGGQVSTDNADPSTASDPTQDEGPTTALAQAQDSAISGFYADLALKDGIYSRLSKVVGAFDHKAMDARGVIRYGVKKLGIKCADGAEQIAIEAYLNATEKAQAAARKTVQTRAADAAVPSSPDIDQYIAQGSK